MKNIIIGLTLIVATFASAQVTPVTSESTTAAKTITALTSTSITTATLTASGNITAANLTTTTDAAAGDWDVATNLTVGGTATVTGALIGSSTLDVDSITVDAGAGLDTAAAGTLELGVLTADQINVGITAVETDILGTLNVTEAASFDAAVVCDTTLEVTGVATLTSAPVFVAVTAGGGATALMTNAPAITEETPTWITVTIGGNNFVIPAWDLD